MNLVAKIVRVALSHKAAICGMWIFYIYVLDHSDTSTVLLCFTEG